MIHQLLYRSRADIEVSPVILACIGHQAEERNPTLGITGLLCHQDGMFIQVLEGPRSAVELMMEKIADDGRHHEIEVISRRDIPEREFGQWAMAVICENDERAVELLDRGFENVAGEPMVVSAGYHDIERINMLRAD